MRNLVITLDRKATIYTGSGDPHNLFRYVDSNNNVILCSDGTNVEYCLNFLFDDRRPPFSELQIELNITGEEFLEKTQGEDTYVDLVLISSNKVGVFITTKHYAIYDEVHTIR